MTLEDDFRQTAEAHWKFIEKWMHMVYVDAMIHGFKHGVEICREAEKELSNENSNTKRKSRV